MAEARVVIDQWLEEYNTIRLHEPETILTAMDGWKYQSATENPNNVIEKGALADIVIVDGNPLEDMTVIGGNPRWFDAPVRGQGIESIRVIMKDGKLYKNTLVQ